MHVIITVDIITVHHMRINMNSIVTIAITIITIVIDIMIVIVAIIIINIIIVTTHYVIITTIDMIVVIIILIIIIIAMTPVHLLRVSLLRVLESNFPGDPLSTFTDMRIPPLIIKSLPESNPLKSKLLVGGLGVIQT